MNTTEKKLAGLIREHPHLYDQSRQDYKNNLKGHLSWKEIAEAMEKPEEEVKQKWKNLRDKFCKAKKRLVRRNCPTRDDDDDENPVLRQVPVLYNQLAWLGAYVKPRLDKGTKEPEEVGGSADDMEKERAKEERLQLDSSPVLTSTLLVDSSSSNHQGVGASHKRKRQTTDTDTSCADALSGVRDEDELFLLSLLPSIKRLTIKKRMEVRMKFQQVLYAAEFEDQQ